MIDFFSFPKKISGSEEAEEIRLKFFFVILRIRFESHQIANEIFSARRRDIFEMDFLKNFIKLLLEIY